MIYIGVDVLGPDNDVNSKKKKKSFSETSSRSRSRSRSRGHSHSHSRSSLSQPSSGEMSSGPSATSGDAGGGVHTHYVHEILADRLVCKISEEK